MYGFLLKQYSFSDKMNQAISVGLFLKNRRDFCLKFWNMIFLFLQPSVATLRSKK